MCLNGTIHKSGRLAEWCQEEQNMEKISLDSLQLKESVDGMQ